MESGVEKFSAGLIHLTIEDANRLHKEDWARLIDKYGSAFKVPQEEVARQAEVTRARLCLATNSEKCPEQTPVGKLKWYGFTEAFIAAFGFDLSEHTAAPRNADKRKQADAWWHENVGAQIKPQELADAVGWSYSTALDYIKDNVTVFFPVKRGLYEVRDPKVERERDKQRQLDG